MTKMKKIQNKKVINLKATLLSGQAFRIIEELDNSFTIILKDRVVNIKEDNDYLILTSNKEDNLEEVVNEYLDLNRDYDSINKYLINNNPELKEIIEYSKGYKILNQPDFEMLISYIISQNNSVRNISSSIEKISKRYGKKVIFNNKEYYLFPTFNELKKASIEDLNECKVGFRSKYIINALNELERNSNYLEELNNMDSETAMNKLMTIKGIGMKVASCILLFGYGKLDTFPIDTWVKKFFNEENQNKIKEKALKKYGKYSGLVIQYMFHYSRNKNVL